MTEATKDLNGRKLGQTKTLNLVSNKVQVTPPCVNASVTVSDESADVRTVTIVLKDARGKAIDYVETFEIHMFTTAARTAYAVTGGSTGLAIGTDGALLALVAKKIFVCTSEANGQWDGTYTDTGTEAMAIGVKLPTGRFVMGSQLLTNA